MSNWHTGEVESTFQQIGNAAKISVITIKRAIKSIAETGAMELRGPVGSQRWYIIPPSALVRISAEGGSRERGGTLQRGDLAIEGGDLGRGGSQKLNVEKVALECDEIDFSESEKTYVYNTVGDRIGLATPSKPCLAAAPISMSLVLDDIVSKTTLKPSLSLAKTTPTALSLPGLDLSVAKSKTKTKAKPSSSEATLVRRDHLGHGVQIAREPLPTVDDLRTGAWDGSKAWTTIARVVRAHWVRVVVEEWAKMPVPTTGEARDINTLCSALKAGATASGMVAALEGVPNHAWLAQTRENGNPIVALQILFKIGGGAFYEVLRGLGLERRRFDMQRLEAKAHDWFDKKSAWHASYLPSQLREPTSQERAKYERYPFGLKGMIQMDIGAMPVYKLPDEAKQWSILFTPTLENKIAMVNLHNHHLASALVTAKELAAMPEFTAVAATVTHWQLTRHKRTVQEWITAVTALADKATAHGPGFNNNVDNEQEIEVDYDVFAHQ